MRKLLFLCIPLLLLCSCHNKQLEVSEGLELESLEVYTDTTSSKSIEQVLALEDHFKNLNFSVPNFRDTPYSHWLKLEVTNSTSKAPNYSLITRGLDSLYVYEIASSDSIKKTLAGAHITGNSRHITDSYINVPLSIPPNQKVTILLRPSNWNYKLSLYPFQLLNALDTEAFFIKRQLLKSLYMGGMMLLFLFGMALFILFKSRLYLYYSICVALSLALMLTNFEYVYTLLGYIPHVIANKNIYGVFTSLLPLSYLYFAEEFLQVPDDIKKPIKSVILYLSIITFSLVFTFLYFNLSFFRYRKFFEVLIFVLCATPLVILYYSFKAQYKPAWIFLFATMPVLVTGILESLSEWHNIPTQQIHNIYYASTFFELFVLTIGLSFKFKTLQEEKRQHSLAIVDKEVSAREKERRQIGQAMHDNVGALLIAAKLKFDSLKDKFDSKKDKEALEKGLQIIDESAHTIREFSHLLSPSSFLQLGLVEGLKAIYAETQNPSIKVIDYGYNNRLEIELEDQLFSIVREAVSNAIKHSLATEITVSISIFKEDIQLVIEDDGVGFDNKKSHSGMGIANLTYRIEERLKGSLKIDSIQGNGTTLLVFIPR